MSYLNVYIITSDKTYHILDISLYFWNKYMPHYNKIVLGFNHGKEYCDKYKNIKFLSIGNNQDINKFTYYLFNYLQNISDNYIILSLDDFFPLSSIKNDMLKLVYNKMKNNNKFIKCVLNSSYYIEKNDIIIDDLLCSNSNNYKLSLQLSLWEKNYLLNYLKIPLSPWDFEHYITNDFNYYVIKSTNIEHDYVFKNRTIIKNFQPNYIIQTNPSSHLSSPYSHINLLGLSFNDINEVINKGKIKTENICFGHYKNNNKLLLYSNIKNSNDLYKSLLSLNNNFTKEYYYLYNNIYNFE